MTETKSPKARPCARCHEAPRSPSGAYCNPCKAAYGRAHRAAYRDLSEAERRKARARATARMAVARGTMRIEPCSRCGAAKAERHHPDYSRPLEVVWLCTPCHRAEHKAQKLALHPPGLPEGATAYCADCRRPTKGKHCPACRVRKCRGASVVGASCPICGINEPRVLRHQRFTDGARILCANHAAMVGQRLISWADLLEDLARLDRKRPAPHDR
jgi:hypothetical protein